MSKLGPFKRRLRSLENGTHPEQISSLWAIAFLLVAISVFCLCHLKFNTLPTANLSRDDDQRPAAFNARRARDYLHNLTRHGPKVAGSELNEVFAVEYLLAEIDRIEQQPNGVHQLDVLVQKADGSLFLSNNGGQSGNSATYKGVQNVVVRLRPATTNDAPPPLASLLINSHYDTVAVSPGGGDASTLVSVMLETLRVLTLAEQPFEHAVIFLFNGCEESGLQGSHAFVTQHEWAASVRAVLNFDAAGNGGREIMFQATAGHSWLMDYYRKHAPHPYGSAMAEELFQANLIPSDTDFRIFRDFGAIPGMDFAYNTNGYVYHTAEDRAEIVPDGTLQHTGDNMFALIKALANSKELHHPDEHKEENAVFFDFLNLFMVYYTQTEAKIINSVVIAVCLVLQIASACIPDGRRDGQRAYAWYWFALLAVVQILSLALGCGLTIALSFFYDAIGYSMRWFHASYLIFGLYMCPLYFAMSLGPAVFNRFSKRLTPAQRIELMLNVQCIVYMVVLAAAMVLGFRTGFMVMVPILFYAISVLVQILLKWFRIGTIWRLGAHFIVQILPFCFYCTWTVIAFATFIPFAGRNGESGNPEAMISYFAIAMGLLLAGFLLPVIPIFKSPLLVAAMFGWIWILSVILMLTPAGFPYAKDVTPQRQNVIHMNRVFYNLDGVKRRDSSGYLIRGQDRNHHLIRDYIDVAGAVDNWEECRLEWICGLPFLGNAEDTALFIPAEKPILPWIEADLRIISASPIDGDLLRYEFQLTCPNNCLIYISPAVGARLIKSSLHQVIPTRTQFSHGQPIFPATYFNLDRTENRTDLDFTLDLKLSDAITTGKKLNVGILAQYTAHRDNYCADFGRLLNDLPDWITTTDMIATFHSYEF